MEKRIKKYTSGPWRLHANAFCHVVSDRARGIAQCGGYSDSHNYEKVLAENNANAHLIAAAPELLEALERLCEEVNQLDLCEAPQYAISAIAKAYGEES